jgi:sterol desaturase/sphingolipid hydroxylase (fatty acid hydroxylase superfamily)
MTFDEALNLLSQDELTAIALPAFFSAILIEAVLSRRQNLNLYQFRDFLVSMSQLVISALVDLIPKVLAVIGFFYLHEISPFRDVVQRQWWAWLLLFFLDDFVYYWFHRANHEVRFLWAGHVSHHSSVKMNFGTALRQGVGERVHKYLFWMPLPLLGFDPLMIVIMISLNLIYQFWVHTELVTRLPVWTEQVFNTPSHHRVHHGSNVRYLDCNHGGVLIIWDRLFGTFSEESNDEPVVYGLTKNIDTTNPITVAFGEYRNLLSDVVRAENLADKLKYVLLAPGWSHDGPDRRAKVMRQATNVEMD